jgi:2-methylcitrate dehydratase PrpD
MLTRHLAEFAATLSFEHVPSDVVRLAKALVLDTLGTTLAATTLGEGCGEVVAVMQRLGGPPESTIFGHTPKVAAPNAAFANGALAHALNYDAVGAETGHTGVAAFAAPFAVAEAAGPTSGERFLTAVVVAAEVTARLMQAAIRSGHPPAKRLLSGQYFSYFGAAAGAAHVLGADAARMHSTFGLALMQIAGSRQVVIGGDPPAKAVYGAFPNHGGVLAALLAQAGLGAEIDAIDGPAGLYGLATDGRFDEATLVGDLGQRFAFVDLQFKPWPTSNHVAPFIEAALALAAEGGPPAAIELAGSSHVRDWFEPLPERRRPSNAASAANSAPFAVAGAFAHGAVSLADYAPAGLRDDAVLAIAERITYRLDDRIEGGIVATVDADGRRREVHVATPLGDRTRPLSRERLEAKFRDCCAHATGVSAAAATRLIELIAHLETVADVSALADG